jgi:hypothetical protein
MGRRFAILIGVAATGVMALGAQTGAAASEGIVSYGTTVTILEDRFILHGRVRSEGGSKCRVGREVILFKKRPGPDRKLGATRSTPRLGPKGYLGVWWLERQNAEPGRFYAKATRKVGDGFVCLADRSPILTVR